MKPKTPLLDLLNKLKHDADSVSTKTVLGKIHWLFRYTVVLGASLLFGLGMLFGGGGGGYATYEGNDKDDKNESS